jgi:hypothetical protein
MDIKWNLSAFNAVRTSDQMEAALLDIAEELADTANQMHDARGYAARSSKGKKRARAAVVITDTHTARSNSKHNTLPRVIGGAS